MIRRLSTVRLGTVCLGAAIAFQIIVLAGMVAKAAMPLWTGTEIRVRTMPVDPRSMFRGNYARLRYEFGILTNGALTGAGGLRMGEVVYVSLEPGTDGLHGFAGASLEMPAEGIFLRGRLAGTVEPRRVKFGIEAYFAPEDRALQIESDLRDGGIAVLMVTDGGRAALRDVIPDPGADPDPDADPDPPAISSPEPLGSIHPVRPRARDGASTQR